MDDIEIFSLHEKDEGSSQESSASSSEESSVTSFASPPSIGDQNDTVSLQDSSQDEAINSSPAHLLDDMDAEIPKEDLIIHLDSPSLPPTADAPDADHAEDDHQSHQQSSGSTTTSHDEEESSDVDSLVGRYDGRSRFPAVLIEDDDDVCTSVEEDASKEQNSQTVEEVPWWIDFVRKECLGEGDELVAFDAAQDFIIETNSVVSGEGKHIDETDDEVAQHSHDDDASHSKDDAVKEIDWQERLWNAARQHYLLDEGPDELDLEAAEDIDAATLVASFDRFDGNRDQIARFQQKLRVCLDAYVEVFHDSPLDELEYDGDDEPPISFINAASSDVQLSPYVPYDTARILFRSVLLDLDPERYGEGPPNKKALLVVSASRPAETPSEPVDPVKVDAAAGLGRRSGPSLASRLLARALMEPDPPPRSSDQDKKGSNPAVRSIDDDVQVLLNALISPELGAFDRFSIQPHTDDNCDTQSDSKSSPPVGRRVKKETELTKQRRQELEEALYGDMKPEAKNEQTAAEHQQVKVEKVEDEEIRLNAAALEYIRERRKVDRNYIDCQSSSPSVSFAQQILPRLSWAGHKKLKSRSEPTEDHSVNRRFGTEHELSLNQIYILRYLPTFLLRAAWRDKTVDVDRMLHSEMFKPLLSIFCNREFIGQRLSAFGILNGVFVHIEEADSILVAFRQRSLDEQGWAEYYRKIHTSLIRCLENVLERQMRCAGFVKSEVDSRPTSGWEGDYDAMSGNGIDFMRVASSCLEISRALHFVGTNLGGYEQSILGSSVVIEGTVPQPPLEFNADSTLIEIKAYGGAKGGYHAALHLLRSAEKKARNETKRRASFSEATSTSIEAIYVARSSVELYLADTMTTLAYCLEEKQRDHPSAVEAYQEALALYSKHAGKKHSTVIHSLQSVGIIHMEQKQWNEARQVLEEAFDLMTKSVQSCSSVQPSPLDETKGHNDNSLSGENAFSDEDLAGIQRSIGVCQMEREEYAKAADAFSGANQSMQKHLQSAPIDRDLDPIDDCDETIPLTGQRMEIHPFICDVLSRLAEAHYLLGVDSSRRLLRHQFRKIFSDEVAPDASIEGLCFSRLQAEQKSLAITEEVIKMRQRLLETDTDGQNPLAWSRYPNEHAQQQEIPLPSDKAFCFTMALDLIRIGTLYFHLQRYSDAGSRWQDAARLLGEIRRKMDGDDNNDIVHWICKVTFLLGIANMRNSLPEEALRFFNASLQILGEFHANGVADSDSINLDIGRCEHAIGTTLIMDKKGALAETHLLNALRIFRAVSKRRRANASTNCAIAAVMTLLGRLDLEANKLDRALGFLKGASQIYSFVGKKIAKVGPPIIKSAHDLFGNSLGQLILATGDAYRCLASVQKAISDEACRTSFETAVLVLESYNSVSELKVQFDEETDLEFLDVSFHGETSLFCYQQLLEAIHDKPIDLQDAAEESCDVHLTKEDLLFRMGNIYARSGESNSALRCFIEAKKLSEARLGTSQHSIIVNILFNMGCVHQNIFASSSRRLNPSERADARKKATWAFGESLRISKLIPGGPDGGQEETCTRLACLLMVNDEFELFHPENDSDDEAAKRYLLESIALRRKRGDEQSFESAESLYRLGIIALRRWDGSKSALEAENHFRKSLDIRLAILGDHVDVAKPHYALAVAMWKSIPPEYDEDTDYSCQEAMQHLNEALRIQTVFYELGKHDHDADQWELLLVLVKILFAVGSIFEFQCEQRRALTRYIAALEFLETYETEYKSHPGEAGGGLPSLLREWQAKLVYSLAHCRIKCDLYEESIEGICEFLKKRCVEVSTVEDPENTLSQFVGNSLQDEIMSPEEIICAPVVNLLGVSYYKIADMKQALQAFSFSLQVSGILHGRRCLQVAEDLLNVARIYFEVNDFHRCIQASRQAFILQNDFGVGDQKSTKKDALHHLNFSRSLLSTAESDNEARLHLDLAIDILEQCIEQSSEKESSTGMGTSLPTEELIGIDASCMEMLLECYYSTLLIVRRQSPKPNATDEEADILQHIGNAEATLGYYEKAKKTFNEVLEALNFIHGPDHLSVADVFFNLGNVLSEMQETDSARECHEEYHRIASQILGTDNPELAENLICLGNVEFSCEKYKDALDCYDRALVLLRSLHANQDIAIGKVLQRKGIAHEKLGQYEEAIEALGEVLQVSRTLHGTNHLELSGVLTSLGNVHTHRRELKKALKCHQESLRIRMGCGDELSSANSKNNIAACLASIGHIDEAKFLYAESLLVKSSSLGMNHVETARTLYNFGQLYASDQQHRLAERFYREALKVFQINDRVGFEETASCLFSLGIVNDELGDEKRALDFFQQARDLLQQSDGPKTSPLLSTVSLALGEALVSAGDFVAAIDILEEALGASEQIDALSRARIKFNLAKAFKVTGSSEKALSLHEQALSLRLEVLGEDHLNVASSLFSLAELYTERRDYKQALSLLSECARIQAMHGVRDGMFFGLTELHLGLALRKVGKLDNSAVHLRRALISTESARGKESVEAARASFEMGTVLCELGQLKNAAALLQQSLGVQMEFFGRQHPDVASTIEHIAIVEQSQGNHRRALNLFGEALEIKRGFVEEYGDEIASLLHSMAVSHMELEHFKDASRIFEECVTRFRAIYGLRHEMVARTLVKQGSALEKDGNLGDALRCYKEALSCRSLKESSVEVGQLLFLMGNASFAMGYFTASWKLFNKAVELLERNGSELNGDEQKQNDEHIIICYERLMRLARASSSSLSIDKMIILPKIALALVRLQHFSKAASIYRDILTRQRCTEDTSSYEIASSLHNLGSCLLELDEWSEALVCLDESLQILRDIPDVPSLTVADSVHCLGLIHQARTDLHEALTCFQEAADLRKRSAPQAHARSTLSLAIILQDLGMHDISMKRCNDAMRIFTDLQNEDPLLRADTIECMGLNHKARGEHQKAVRCFRDSLEERQRNLGDGDLIVGQTLTHLGEALRLGGDGAKAYECFRKAERIYGSHIGSRLEKEHMSNIDGRLSISGMVKFTSDLSMFMESQEAISRTAVADTMSTFGRLKFLCKHFDEALICSELALAIYREELSPDHLKIADTNFTMGASRYERGDAEGSIMHLNESLQLRRKKLGDNHFDVFKTRQYLGRALAATGDTNEALICYRAITTTNFRGQYVIENSEEVGMMFQMGKLHLAAQEFSEAAFCFEDCLKLQQNRSNSNDRQRLAETLHCLGLTQFEMKMYAEAQKNLQSALQIREEEDGNEIAVIDSLFLLGRLTIERHEYSRAMSLFEKCQDVLDGNTTDQARKVLPRLRLQMGKVHFDGLENYDEARSCLESSREMLSQESDMEHEDMSECLIWLGRLYSATGDLPEAKKALESAREIIEQYSDLNSPLRGDALHYLGVCLFNMHALNDAHFNLVEGLRVRLVNYGSDYPGVGESHRRLAHLELQLAKQKSSLEHFVEAIRVGMLPLKAGKQLNYRQVTELRGDFEVSLSLALPYGDAETIGKLWHEKGTLQSLTASYDDALASYREAIACYKQCYGDGHLSIGNVLLNCGICMNETNDFGGAIKCLTQSLGMTKSELGEEHDQVADVLIQLCDSYRRQSDFKQALRCCEEALRIKRRTESIALAQLMGLTGELHAACGHIAEAERLMKECIRVRRSLQGDDAVDVATALFKLGELYELHLVDHRKALRCYEESLRIRKLNSSEDENAFENAQAYLHLGRVHTSLGGFEKAHFCLDQAMELCVDDEGVDNELSVEAEVAKGLVFSAQGNNQDAIVQFIRAYGGLQMIHFTKGGKDEEIGDLLCQRSAIYSKMGETDDALDDLDFAIKFYQPAIGKDHWKVAEANQAMAEMHLKESHNEKALACANEALRIRKALFGDGDERTGDSSYIVGKVYFIWNDFERARPYLEAALSAHREARGTRNLAIIADSLYYLGCIYESTQDVEDALSCFQGALSGRQQHLGRDHESVSEVLFKLGRLHDARGEYDLAVDCLRECRRIRLLVYGPDHVKVADTLYQLAGSLYASRRSSRKLKPTQYYIEAIRIYKLALGEEHVAVAKCLDSLGGVFEDKDSMEKAGRCYERAVRIFEASLHRDVTREEVRNLELEEDYEAYAGSLLDLATYYDRTGKDVKALKNYHRALKLFKTLLGDGHDVIATILCNIANLLARQRRHEEAMALFDEALRRRIATFGKDDPLIGQVYFHMGILHDTRKNYNEALDNYEQALKTQQHTDAALTLSHMGMLHGNKGEFALALQMWDDALALYKQAGLADNDPVVVAIVKHQATAKQMLQHTVDDEEDT